MASLAGHQLGGRPGGDVRPGLDLLLPDLPAYRTGLIIVGLARCIAMVIIWNDLACGDREAAAVLVALNSVFQVIAFGRARLVLPRSCCPAGSASATASTCTSRRGRSPERRADLPRHPAAGRIPDPPHRREAAKGRDWYETGFLPKIGPWALYGLLFTIVILFALQGKAISHQPVGRRPHRPAAAGLLRHHVGRHLRPRQAASAWPTTAPRRWRSPPPATTSNSPSRSPSPPSASPPARPWPASSARSSRCPSSSPWSTSPSPGAVTSPPRGHVDRLPHAGGRDRRRTGGAGRRLPPAAPGPGLRRPRRPGSTRRCLAARLAKPAPVLARHLLLTSRAAHAAAGRHGIPGCPARGRLPDGLRAPVQPAGAPSSPCQRRSPRDRRVTGRHRPRPLDRAGRHQRHRHLVTSLHPGRCGPRRLPRAAVAHLLVPRHRGVPRPARRGGRRRQLRRTDRGRPHHACARHLGQWTPERTSSR